MSGESENHGRAILAVSQVVQRRLAPFFGVIQGQVAEAGQSESAIDLFSG